MTDERRLDVEAMHRLVKLDPPVLRRAEVAELGGVSSDHTVRWWRAMGFPEFGDEERAFSNQDVDMVRQLNSLLVVGLVDDEDILRLARLMGASFSRLADAQIAVVDDFLASLPGADPEESRRSRLSALVASEDADVLDFLEDSIVYVWRRHLLAAIGRWISVDDETTEQSVGFADMSGFSRLTKRVSSDDLADTIEAFEAAAFDVVSSHEGRVVKLIGDEVMFVTPDLEEGVAIAVDLVNRLEEVDIVPPVHCGVAFGPTVTVGGDVFGPTVNLASRLTEVARPGTIAVDRDAAGSISENEDLHVRRVRRHYDLKGVGRTLGPPHPAQRADHEEMSMQPTSDSTTSGPPVLDPEIAKSWPVAMFIGVVTLVIGVMVIAWPSQTLTVLAVLLGLQLLLFGLYRLIHSFSSDVSSHGLMAFAGILGMVAGVIVLRNPFETLAVLATLLGVVWIVGGAIELMTAIVDGSHGDRWLMVFSGLLSIAAGVVVVAWPAPTLTVIAWIAGLYLVFSGILIGFTAFKIRSLAN